MKVKASSLILLAFALVLALAAAFIARSMLGAAAPQATARAAAEEKRVPPVYVLTAERALTPGTFINAQVLRWVPMKAEDVPAGAVSSAEASRGKALQDYFGATIRREVKAGECLSQDLFLFPGNPGFIAAVLSPGMRAVSIPTSAVSSNSGLVNAGDWVDVIVSLGKTTAESMAQEGDRTAGYSNLASQTILENVRVLASNSNTASLVPQTAEEERAESRRSANTQPQRRAVYETITLEVTPEAAEKLAVAKELGALQVALRGLRDGDAPVKRADDKVTRLEDVTGILGKSSPQKQQVQVFLGPQAQNLTF